MKDFFKVSTLKEVLSLVDRFQPVGMEKIHIDRALGRITAEKIVPDSDLPAFSRSTMDGYAVKASSTYGASESSPGFLTLAGMVFMGDVPEFKVGPGQAAAISTGGMLPDGTDSVVMIEYTEKIDDSAIEIYKSVAPGEHVIEAGEDFRSGQVAIDMGVRLRPQETGLLAAFGKTMVNVYRKPKIGVISTGDEVVPIEETPGPGKIRDINTYTLGSFVRETGADPVCFGIAPDDRASLSHICGEALEQCDMVLVSGGSSVGIRDYTVEVFSSLPDSQMLTQGVSIRPGKPTILAVSGGTAFWGLPGHAVSAMIVFHTTVKPFIERISGLKPVPKYGIPAELTRNLPSAQGRIDYVRVRINRKDGRYFAEPVLGKSGLLNTMILADGLIEIDRNSEGLEKGATVSVLLIR